MTYTAKVSWPDEGDVVVEFQVKPGFVVRWRRQGDSHWEVLADERWLPLEALCAALEEAVRIAQAYQAAIAENDILMARFLASEIDPRLAALTGENGGA